MLQVMHIFVTSQLPTNEQMVVSGKIKAIHIHHQGKFPCTKASVHDSDLNVVVRVFYELLHQ